MKYEMSEDGTPRITLSGSLETMVFGFMIGFTVIGLALMIFNN